MKKKPVAKFILGGIFVKVEFSSSAHAAWPYSFRETEGEHSVGDWCNDQWWPINVHAQKRQEALNAALMASFVNLIHIFVLYAI